MKILSLSDENIAEAAEIIKKGGVAAFPTETVYGLGADAFNTRALAKIFEIKNRPHFDPLIIHIAALKTLDRLVLWEALDSSAKEKINLLIKNFWPGPLTLVLPKRKEVPDLATSGLPTAAIRFPLFPAAQKLIDLSTGAVAAPSANPFGFLSPTKACHVISQLGEKADCIIDGGSATLGIESTVINLSGTKPALLRHGGIGIEQIESVIGKLENQYLRENETTAESPGRLKNHYAPHTPLYVSPYKKLIDVPYSPDEGRLYFSLADSKADSKNEKIKILSTEGNLNEAAANFFSMLHELDAMDLKLIRAEEAPRKGLGYAINDRLKKASFKE